MKSSTFDLGLSLIVSKFEQLLYTLMVSNTIHANSPGYGTDLHLSRMGHHISRIKSSFELFCALV